MLNNRDLNMVTCEQRMMVDDIRFIASQKLPDFSYAAFADSIGLRGSGLSDTSKWPSPGISL